MKVRFFTFSKKYNSTAQPSTGYTEYDCVIKSSSDVITPTVELQMGLSTNPSSFNYCYIPDYNRYYWVKDWTFYNHLWVATLNVDVLATWKPYIGSTSMYVYRASNEYDGTIIDEKYPTTSTVTFNVMPITPVGVNFKDGWFVIGVYGTNTNVTSMSYYAFSGTRFTNFINELYVSCLNSSIWNGLNTGTRNAIFDISSYIKCCYWIPYYPSPQAGEPLSSICIGAVQVSAVCRPIYISDSGYTVKFDHAITVPKHPQARTRGGYCNLTPYSKYSLVYLPFGVMELDSSKLVRADRLLLTVEIDGITGEGVLTVVAQRGSGNVWQDLSTVVVRNAKYSVDIPISVSTNNFLSTAGSVIGGRAMARFGHPARAIFGIGSLANLKVGGLENATNFRSGVLGIDYDKNCLQAEFSRIVDEDILSNGRPLCKVRTPANLGGYIEAESNEFSAPATIDEMEEIKRFIDNGFYYE